MNHNMNTLFIGAHPDDIEVKMGHLAASVQPGNTFALVASLGRAGQNRLSAASADGHCLCR